MGREDAWQLRDDRTLSWAAKLVWLMLESRGDDCRPSQATIAADCGISRRQVSRAIAELDEQGWLKVAPTVTSTKAAGPNSYMTVSPARHGVTDSRTPLRHTGVGVVTDRRRGYDCEAQEEEKGSVKEKSKKTSKDPSSERSPDPGPDAPGTRPEIDRICEDLASRVETLTGRRPNITVTGWLRPARYLLDIDGLSEDQIRAAIKFAAEDEFWAPNIRSVSKLRDKLPQLRAAAVRRSKAGGGNRHQQNQAATEAYLAAVDEYESQQEPSRKEISS